MTEFSPKQKITERHRELYKATTPPWKETYRKRCYARFRSSRERLVDTFRQFPTEKTLEIPEMMDLEWNLLQKEQQMFDESELEDELCTIQKEILKELLAEDELFQSEYEANLDFQRRIDCRFESDQSSDDFLCPLCQKRPLKQSFNVIHCDCGLQIDTEQDCLKISDVKRQVLAGLEAHNGNCDCNPSFSQMNGFGISNIILSCSSCDFLFIVI